MLTEKGYDKALDLLNIPSDYKPELPIKSYEVQKIVESISAQLKPESYNPFNKRKKTKITTEKSIMRNRGFRQAIINIYDYKCCVCGLKLRSPDKLRWEVQAAHIVPHRYFGRDDIWNGLALCQLHHWAFDVGLFSCDGNFKVVSLMESQSLGSDYGMIFDYDFLDHLKSGRCFLKLPKAAKHYPDMAAINWHRT